MFYKSVALSPGTKVATLAVSGSTSSVRFQRSLAPAAQVTSHPCSPGAGTAFPLLSPGASCPAGGDELLFPATTPGCISKGDTNSPTTGSFQKQTSWVTFHARNAIMLTQTFKATDFSYPDVEGVIVNSRWEVELLLPCTASVQQAPAQPPQAGTHASLTPTANRDQQTARGPKRLQAEAGSVRPSPMPRSQSSTRAPRWL